MLVGCEYACWSKIGGDAGIVGAPAPPMLAAADLLGCTLLYEVAPRSLIPFLPVLAWLLCWPADFLAKRSTSQAEAACTGTKMTGPTMGTVISNIWGARNALMVNSLSLQHHQHLISTPHLQRQHQRLIYT